MTEDIKAVIRQAIRNSHDETYRYPEDVAEHVERVTQVLAQLLTQADACPVCQPKRDRADA